MSGFSAPSTNITAQPGDSITVAAKSVAASPSWVIVGLNTREDS